MYFAVYHLRNLLNFCWAIFNLFVFTFSLWSCGWILEEITCRQANKHSFANKMIIFFFFVSFTFAAVSYILPKENNTCQGIQGKIRQDSTQEE